MNCLRSLVLTALFAIGGGAFAQVDVASATRSGGKESAINVVGALKKCDSFRRSTLAHNPAVVSYDALGRPQSIKLAGRYDYVFEYVGSAARHPIALIGMGGRLDLSIPGANSDASRVEQAMVALRGRLEAYRSTKLLCGIEPVGGMVVQGSSGLEENPEFLPPLVPKEYLEPDFWQDYWMPDYEYYRDEYLDFSTKNKTPHEECVDRCEKTCDASSEVVGWSCAMIGGYIGLANPPVGLVVTGACGLGSIAGKYICRGSCNNMCYNRQPS